MTGKKTSNTTDIDSIMGSARRAEHVPRPITPPAEALPPAKRVNIMVDSDLHRQLKILSAQKGRALQDVADEALQTYLAALSKET